MKDIRKKLFGLRQSAVIETALFLVVMLVLDGIFFSGNRFFSVAPHPFWIIVLLVSVQYGTNEGLFAAVLSTLVLLVGNMPEQQVQQDLYEYIFMVSLNPLTWIIAATIIGEIRQRQLREREMLEKKLSESSEREDTIARAYDNIKELKEKLEIRIAGQFRTAIKTYLAAKSIDKLNTTEVLRGIEGLIESVMSPQKFSVFLISKSKLENAIHYGWTSEDKFPSSYASDSKLFQEVIGRQRYLCNVNKDDEKILQKEGMLVGPLVNQETGEVLGMIKIESLGFLDLTVSSVEEFRVLCEWIALAYANAKRYEQAESESLINPENNLFSYGFFQRQLAFVTALARRTGFDVSAVFIKLANASELSEEHKRLSAIALNEAVRESLRNVDQPFDHQRGDAEFAVILPATPAANAQLVVDKIKTGLDKKLKRKVPGAKFSYTVQPLHETEAPSATAAKRKAR